MIEHPAINKDSTTSDLLLCGAFRNLQFTADSGGHQLRTREAYTELHHMNQQLSLGHHDQLQHRWLADWNWVVHLRGKCIIVNYLTIIRKRVALYETASLSSGPVNRVTCAQFRLVAGVPAIVPAIAVFVQGQTKCPIPARKL